MTGGNTQSRVVGFIRGRKTWCLHPTREKTHRACVEVLCRVPETVRAYVMESQRLLLTAPGINQLGQVNSYQIETKPAERRHDFQVVVLCSELESLKSTLLIAIVARYVAVAYQQSTPGKKFDTSPENLALLWGFPEIRELSKLAGKAASAVELRTTGETE